MAKYTNTSTVTNNTNMVALGEASRHAFVQNNRTRCYGSIKHSVVQRSWKGEVCIIFIRTDTLTLIYKWSSFTCWSTLCIVQYTYSCPLCKDSEMHCYYTLLIFSSFFLFIKFLKSRKMTFDLFLCTSGSRVAHSVLA